MVVRQSRLIDDGLRKRCSRRSARALGLALVLAGALGCGREAPAPRASAPPSLADPVVEVEVRRLGLGSISQVISAAGSVVARRESQIGTEVTGRIVRVHVSEGDRVAAGDPLFEVDPVPYEIALRQAEAVLDVARAERLQGESDLTRARTLRRQNVLAEQEIERLSTTVAVARARERQADEAVALARHQLERTRVSAPFGGSVARRLADEGTTALLQPQTIVVVLQETDELEAQVAVPESQMAHVRPGDPALVRIEGIPAPVESRVFAVSDSIDLATRTYMVKMAVPNPERSIKAGVFAHVEISPRGAQDRLLAPREAIRTEGGSSRLLVVRDGRAVLLPVELGVVSEDEAEVVSGAEPGEMAIVGRAAHTLAPGMRVRATQHAEAS